MKGIVTAVALAAGVTGIGSAAPAPEAPIPVEAFAALPQIDTPKLSPDGTRVLTRMAIGGVQTLVIVPLSGDAKPAYLRVPDSVDIN